MGRGPQTNSRRLEIGNPPSASAVCPVSTYELRPLAGRVRGGRKNTWERLQEGHLRAIDQGCGMYVCEILLFNLGQAN